MAASGDETKLVINQHYDESLEVNDSEEVASVYSPSPRKSPAPLGLSSDRSVGRGEPERIMASEPSPSDDLSMKEFSTHRKELGPDDKAQQSLGGTGQNSFSEEDSEEDDDSSSTEDDDDNAGAIEGAYDPADYDHLTVSQEIKELFQYITRYTPQTIDLEHKLKPFNPDYIPAVGDIDAFLKVPRPDNKESTLGLSVLDEPCAKQSDPTVLDLQLRSISKTSGVRAMQVRSVKDADRNPKAIDTWVESMEELHRSKPPQNVHYKKRMPDIDDLMQEWPPEMEGLLSQSELPTAQLNCSLQSYVDIVCSILDIPVHASRIQSLHVLFSLYSAFKELHQFQSDNVENGNLDGQPEVLNFE
ncbi:intraflagellar transport protein 46 homolog [Clavelina lepadiformis]|uniref:Intraflagellar transport protein 46 homolog n=1 Tax=Clavelina lepadiformis TaxID=159417 RepID=A0ABP0EWK2_CLALP